MVLEKTMKDMERLAESARDAIINATDRVMKVNAQIYTGMHEVRQAADDASEGHDVDKKILREHRLTEDAYQDAARQAGYNVEEANEQSEAS